MQALIDTLKAMQPHPFVDHFTVALIVVGVMIDFVASLIPSRRWIRFMALSLMILGASAAACSNLTGGWEAHRLRPLLHGPALDVLNRHAELGNILPGVLAVLALWRLGVEFLGFLHGSRPLYLIAAVLSLCAVLYQGYMGGEMVYDYGVGTALLPTPAATPSPSAETNPLLYYPSHGPTIIAASPSPSAAPPTPTVAPATPTPAPAPSVSVAPTATVTPTPAASASVSPSAAAGTPVTPPPGEVAPGEASPGATPTPRNL